MGRGSARGKKIWSENGGCHGTSLFLPCGWLQSRAEMIGERKKRKERSAKERCCDDVEEHNKRDRQQKTSGTNLVESLEEVHRDWWRVIQRERTEMGKKWKKMIRRRDSKKINLDWRGERERKERESEWVEFTKGQGWPRRCTVGIWIRSGWVISVLLFRARPNIRDSSHFHLRPPSWYCETLFWGRLTSGSPRSVNEGGARFIACSLDDAFS